MKKLLLMTLIGFAFSQKADEIIKKSHLNYYYAKNDGKANVTMTLVDKNENEKVKKFIMSRLDLKEGGEQRYFIYFEKPSDISKMTFMVYKYNDKDDDRWLYIPAIDLVKRIAASDKSSSFVGSDFSYEDVSGRHWTLDNHELIGEEELNGSIVYKVKSIAKTEDYFTSKISYISKENYLPLKEEYFDKNNDIFKRFEVLEVKEIDGVATAIKRKMFDFKNNQYTIINFDKIEYDIGLKEEYFKERYLKKAHRTMR
jgi:hypothetical protein